MENTEEMIFNKLSVENIIENFHKIDKLASILLSEDQFDEFKNDKHIIFNNESENQNNLESFVEKNNYIKSSNNIYGENNNIQKNKF